MQTRGVPRIKPPPIHDLVGPAPPPPDASTPDLGKPKEVKQLSIWEETKFVTDRAMVEEQERAYERRKRHFCADLAACVRSVVARAPPELQPTCASLFELSAYITKLLDLGFPLDKYVLAECLQFLGKEAHALTPSLHVLRFVCGAFEVALDDIWTFFYQLGWTLTHNVEAFLLSAPRVPANGRQSALAQSASTGALRPLTALDELDLGA